MEEFKHENDINFFNDMENIQIPQALIASQSPLKNLPPILIVDDAIFNVFSLQMVLEKNFNLKSDFAYNGEEAIKKVKERH